jgi:hypothetical protein
MISPLAFHPSYSSIRTFQSVDTESQKSLVLLAIEAQSGPTVCPPQKHSLGPTWSISLGPTVMFASLTL